MKQEQRNKVLEIFSENVIWLRVRNRLTKKEMAEIMRTSVQSLRRIERGDIPPRMRLDVLLGIWQHFGIHPKDQLTVRFRDHEPPRQKTVT